MYQKPWALLQCTDPSLPSIPLYDQTTILGRVNPMMKITTPAISSKHFKIYKEERQRTQLYFLEDISTNGTYLNNERIPQKREPTQIKLFDQITLLSPKEPLHISYVFLPLREFEEEKEGNSPFDKYEMKQLIGHGGYSRVFEVIEHKSIDGSEKKSEQKYALKIIDRQFIQDQSHSQQPLLNEYNILRKLNHRNVIHLHDVFLTHSFFYLVFELIEGGDLYKLITNKGQLNELECRNIIKQMLHGLQYLHQNNIIHRDLKLENILLTRSGEVKITDFGLSKNLAKDIARTQCGTAIYASPEVLKGQRQTEKSDVWSVGVILYTLAGGYQPFIPRTGNLNDLGNRELFDLITNAYYTFPSPRWDHVSMELKDLIDHTLMVNPSDRYSIDDCLNHPFISGMKRRYRN